MEGREHPSTGDVYSDHHIKPNSDDDAEYEDLLDTYDETYVIQVPKDQIYRVPPPENAIFAEQRRIAVPATKSRFSAKCMLLSFVILLLVIALIIGICLSLTDKADPTFRVHRVHVTKKSKGNGNGNGNDKQHEFDFTLKSKNPNNQAVILFKKGGKASLSYQETRSFAKGPFPMIKQGTNSLEYTRLKLLSGSGKTLPNEIQKSMNGTSHTAIKLLLRFNVPLSFKVGVFSVKSKRLSIACNVRVKGLNSRSQILSQDCDYSTS